MCKRSQKWRQNSCFQVSKYFLILRRNTTTSILFYTCILNDAEINEDRLSIIHILISKKLLDLSVSALPRFVFLPSVFSFCLSLNVFLWSLSLVAEILLFLLPSLPIPLLSPLSKCDSSHICMHRVHASYCLSGLKWCFCCAWIIDSLLCSSLCSATLGRKKKWKTFQVKCSQRRS